MDTNEKLSRLSSLRDFQEGELQRVLLPDQRKLLDNFGVYASVLTEGFSNSMVHGALSVYLELTPTEQKKVFKAAKKANDEYSKRLVQAQKDAISKIRSALSDEKRKKFDALVDPMKKGDGTILQIKGRMFEVNER